MKPALLIAGLLSALAAFTQEIEFSGPFTLGPEVNTKVEEISPMLSADGQTLYFVRAYDPKNVGGEVAGMDIWISKKNNLGKWQPASNNTAWNNKGSNAVIGVSNDNQVVYLLNAYKNRSGIALSRFRNNQWVEPEILTIRGLTSHDLVGYHMNATENILMVSVNGRNSVGEEDLYVCVKDSTGRWSEPQNLGPTINTVGFEIAPFLSDDGKKLYFSSNGHSGYGDADIFVAERLYNSWTLWTAPKNLGASINSQKFDAYFSIFGDSICYFSSNRDSDFTDIFEAKAHKKVDTVVFEEEIRYLTESEIRQLTGRNFQTVLLFSKESPELTQVHRDRLTAICAALAQKKEIHFRLVASKSGGEDELELYQKRLLNILEFIKPLGVEGSRVTFGSESDTGQQRDTQGVVTLKFYNFAAK